MDTILPRRSLPEIAAEQLRALIHDGTLPPGARLAEVELADRFGISRTPVREAIKMLASEGLAELLPNRGARVPRISDQDLWDLVEAIGGLEGIAADLAAARITAAELDAIRAYHAQLLDAYARRDADAYFIHNRAIHEAIMAAARNRPLQDLYRSLAIRMNPLRFRAGMDEAGWANAVAEHEQMLVLLANRDGQALLGLMRDHVRGKQATIAAAFGVSAADADYNVTRRSSVTSLAG
jgi:DNA-binding GntR family transcriptional regulator